MAIDMPFTIETMHEPRLGPTVIPSTTRGRPGGNVPSFSSTNNRLDIPSSKLIVYASFLTSTVVSTDRNVPGVVCSIVGALDEPTTTGPADTVTGDGPTVVGIDVDGRDVVGRDVVGLDVGPSVRRTHVKEFAAIRT
jgi:hypothetical protein